MSEFQVEVRITPRRGLLDPQGKAVENALRSLEFGGVAGVRVGRLIRLNILAENAEAARAQADDMCRKLLANPVTEDYEVDIRASQDEGVSCDDGAPAQVENPWG